MNTFRNIRITQEGKEMKKLVTYAFALTLLATSYANNGAELPKVMNYKQALSEIEYPQVCRERGIEGKVIVALRIDKHGQIINYKVQSTPCSEMQEAVEAVLPSMAFKPALDENGQPVEGILTLPVNFKLTI